MLNLERDADQPRILVVEDDRILRLLAVETLLEEGFKAIGARRAAEALDQLESSPDIALLITDINMPGMSGLELARLVRQRYPKVRLLLISGREYFDLNVGPEAIDFLQKPFSAHALLTRVQGLLDSD